MIYVDQAVASSGDGATRATAVRTVKEGLDLACQREAPRRVDIAAGTYAEKGLRVTCPMTISGKTVLTYEQGRPTGVDESAATLTKIVATPPLATGESVIRVLADAKIEKLLIDGAVAAPNVNMYDILVGGYPGGASCPAAQVHDVEISQIAAMGGGHGVLSYNTGNLRLSQVFSQHNFAGLTLLGGHGVHSDVSASTLDDNMGYGICAIGSGSPFIPDCPPAASDTQSTDHTFVLTASELNRNVIAGLRNLAILAWAAPGTVVDVPAKLDSTVKNNVMLDNQGYGFVVDFVPRVGMNAMTSPATFVGAFDGNTLRHADGSLGNGRNDTLFGFTLTNNSQNPTFNPDAQPIVFIQKSTATVTTSSPVMASYDNPASVGGTTLENSLMLNGMKLEGCSAPRCP